MEVCFRTGQYYSPLGCIKNTIKTIALVKFLTFNPDPSPAHGVHGEVLPLENDLPKNG